MEAVGNISQQQTGGRPRRSCRPGRHSQGERGFALLLVFAMAAIVAITLYMQLPRVAFEAQRDREKMLIERGEQYRRAIELYVRKNNRYPARLEDLERDQDVRYLRRRYKDPFTGKDEWRVIHINAAGQLEDSLIEKPKTGGNAETASTTAPTVPVDENVAENTALARQRAGDQTAANAQFPGGGGERAGAVAASEPGSAPAQTDALVPLLDANGNVVQRTKTEAEAQAQQAGLVAPGLAPEPNAPVDPSNPKAAGTPQAAPQVRLGPGGIPIIENPSAAVAATGNPQGAAPQAGPGLPGIDTRGASVGGNTPGGAPGQTAKQLLEGLLTTPRPGGLAGIQSQRGIQSGPGAGRSMGAGIAGVASKFEMKGILVYDEQESIHKWEFVYDAQKAAGKASGNPAQSGARAGQPGNPAIPGAYNTPQNNQNRSPRQPGNRPSGPSFGGFGGPGQTSPGQGGVGRPNPGRRN